MLFSPEMGLFLFILHFTFPKVLLKYLSGQAITHQVWKSKLSLGMLVLYICDERVVTHKSYCIISAVLMNYTEQLITSETSCSSSWSDCS